MLVLSTAAEKQLWNKTKLIDSDVWIWALGPCLHDNEVVHWHTADRHLFLFKNL